MTARTAGRRAGSVVAADRPKRARSRTIEAHLWAVGHMLPPVAHVNFRTATVDRDRRAVLLGVLRAVSPQEVATARMRV